MSFICMYLVDVGCTLYIHSIKVFMDKEGCEFLGAFLQVHFDGMQQGLLDGCWQVHWIASNGHFSPCMLLNVQ